MGAKEIDYHTEATADVKNAVDWYLERSPKAAADFIQELERATETIREAPDRWPIGRNGTRRFLLRKFPFAIIYSEQESIIRIWAVAHGSRRPGYWTNRL